MNLVSPKHLFAACALVVCSAVAGYADRFGDFTYVEYDTTIEITDYPRAATGDVIVPSEIVGKPVTSIGESAFHLCTSLTSVALPDSVTSIGTEAFEWCTSLTSVTIPDSVTNIGEGPFIAFHSLTSVTVNAANPAYSSVGGVLFDKNQATLVQFPSGRAGAYTIPNSVTSIADSAFEWCASLTSVTIGNGVRTIGNEAFVDCRNLTSTTIPDSVTSIGDRAFGACTSLTSVTIPDSVTNIGDSAFYNCPSLTGVTIGNGVTSIGPFMFSWCTSLTSITIPDSVTSIGASAFNQCTSLTSVTIPDAVTSIGNEVFYACTNLTSVVIGDGVTSIPDSAFYACRSLTSVTVNAANPAYSSVGGVLFDKNQTVLIQFPFGKAGAYTIPNSVTSIADSGFEWCASLTSVTVPESVITIGRHAFNHCSRLAILYFEGNAPNLTGSTFTFSDIVEVFYLAGTKGWGAMYGNRPTRLTSGTLDPLIGGLDLAEFKSWFVSEWFGPHSTIMAPWIYHAEHGFLYRYPESTSASTYFYDDAMGAWWWTSSDIYPAIYAFDPPADNAGTDIESEWLWYENDTRDPRSFGVLTGDLAGTKLYYDR